MIDVIDTQFDKLNTGLDKMAEAIGSGSVYAKKLSNAAKKQVNISKCQVIAIEKRNELLRRTNAFQYSEGDIWELSEGVSFTYQPLKEQCFDYLCNNQSQTRRLFGMPSHLQYNHLIKLMRDAGLIA